MAHNNYVCGVARRRITIISKKVTKTVRVLTSQHTGKLNSSTLEDLIWKFWEQGRWGESWRGLRRTTFNVGFGTSHWFRLYILGMYNSRYRYQTFNRKFWIPLFSSAVHCGQFSSLRCDVVSSCQQNSRKVSRLCSYFDLHFPFDLPSTVQIEDDSTQLRCIGRT